MSASGVRSFVPLANSRETFFSFFFFLSFSFDRFTNENRRFEGIPRVNGS